MRGHLLIASLVRGGVGAQRRGDLGHLRAAFAAARGDVLDGVSLEAKGQEIFDTILAVASGKKSKSEELGYGDNEFVPWQIGATF